MSCQLCARGATGHDGHAALKEIFRSGVGPGREPSHVIYACDDCGCLWSRRLGPDRAYVWTLKAPHSSPPPPPAQEP